MNVIKDSVEFQNILKVGKWYSSDCLTLYVVKKDQEYNKVGVAVGKKVGKSTIRNHLKRLIREAYRLNECKINIGYDFIIVWKTSYIDEISYNIVEKSLLKCFNKADLMK